ncbi:MULTISPECIES: hypothetical protein [unclassified Legionella]|uniref:hypothetical protein n=1 Tax=unclassified Legionella TaxID=2622702 RepID=UPI001055D1C0|nr:MULTISPECIES: hypothetical protein [unclassified Legionella]MDI9818140.1 hypothetical protein [Legionella sp. PL877]
MPVYSFFKSTFNQRSVCSAALQVANIAAITAAAGKLLTDPEASVSEFGLDILTHVVSYMALGDNADALTVIGAGYVNAARMGAIYAGLASGVSSVPLAVNIVDGLVHLMNIAVPLATTPEESQPVEKTSQSLR